MSLLSNPYITALLTFISPMLAFISLNTSFFSLRQIVASLFVMTLCGAMFGWILVYFSCPDFLCAGLAVIIFFFLSNSFFKDTIKSRSTHTIVFFVSLFVLSTISFFFSLYTINSVLILHILLSIADTVKSIRQNSQHSQDSLFKDIEYDGKSVYLKYKPNIYILFLESVHSQEAMASIYKHDDFGVSNYLRDKGFFVYDDAFSNSDSTTPSVRDLLTMTLLNKKMKQYPALSILKNNGYKIYAYDEASAVFGPYRKYFDETNFDQPPVRRFILNHFAPLIELLPVLKRYCNFQDNFGGGVDFEAVFSSTKTLLARPIAEPKAVFARFGAAHTRPFLSLSEGTTWMASWKRQYLSIYERFASECRQFIDYLVENDPDACIIAVGDHGAAYYRWCKKSDGSLVVIDDEISHSRVAVDAFSVLLAIRWPYDCPPFQGTLSHVNIFRQLFKGLGGQDDFLDNDEKNESRFPDPPVIVVKDGRPLDAWRESGSGDVMPIAKNTAPDAILLASHLISSGRFSDAALLLLKTFPDESENLAHVTLLARVLFRLGKAAEVEEIIRLELKKYGPGSWSERELILAEALMLLGGYDEATRIMDSLQASESLQLCIPIQHSLVLLQQDHRSIMEFYKKHIKSYGHRYAMYLCNKGMKEQACDSLSGNCRTQLHELTCAYIALSIGRYAESEGILRAHMDIESRNVTTRILLISVLEMQKRTQEALSIIVNSCNMFPQNQLFHFHLGAFMIRNKLSHPELIQYKRNAYEVMRLNKETLLKNDFFDASWYQQEYGDLLNGMQPLMHYLLYRNVLFLRPNRHFDYAYYALMNQDAFECGIPPDMHYLACSPFEQRNPSPVFLTTAYITQHPEVIHQGINPLVHYIRTEKEGGKADKSCEAH